MSRQRDAAFLQVLTREGEYHRFLEQILDAVADPLFVKDEDHRWIALNQAFCRLVGRPRGELLGRSDHDFFPKEEADVFHAVDDEVFRSGETQVNEESITTGAGETRILVTKKSLFTDEQGRKFLVGSIRDVTELKHTQRELLEARALLEGRVLEATAEARRAQERLLHSQKLDAVGRLAGGVAHDFNNLLTVMSGSLELVLRAQLSPEESRELVEDALDAVRRGSSLTQRMLSLSRRRALQPRAVRLAEVLGDLEALLRRSLEASIVFAVEVEDPDLVAHVDPGEFETAVLNLCLNAREAMPRGGRLTIRLCSRELSPERAAALGLAPGPYAEVEVRDEGEGMTPAVQARVFEPFFTTRRDGEGTGLGLSMVQDFVSESGGGLGLESEPGQGTRVRLYLPPCDEASRLPELDPPAQAASGSEGQVVLVVDDQPHVRAVVARSLEVLGRVVHEASCVAEALQVAAEVGRLDVLLTDLVLGEREYGDQVADALRELRPELEVIYMSGYADERVRQRVVASEEEPILSKPFSLRQLEQALELRAKHEGP